MSDLSEAIDGLEGAVDKLIAEKRELAAALSCLVAVVGLTAFRHESQRAALQEAVDQASAVLAKS